VYEARGNRAEHCRRDAVRFRHELIAFGHALGPVGLLVPYGIANVLAALPITPAGLGIVEAFMIPALVGFSVPRGTAILGVLAWRGLNFLAPIPVGLAAYLSLPTKHRTSSSVEEGQQHLR